MINKIVQCVPNFSEGRRVEVIEEIVRAIGSTERARVLDYSYDQSHNRSVVTFIGNPEAVLEAAFRGAKKAAEKIDMRRHSGEHPRMGATDVIPFIPITGVGIEECIGMAKMLGRRLADELDIPVYLYETAASCPERENLADVRQGEYEGLIDSITKPERKPDFGPTRVNPGAGATAVGARFPLVPFNINLDTDDVKIAQNIARVIRGSSGGFSTVKALGVMIKETGKAQVTINLCDYHTVPPHRVFEMVKKEAGRYGGAVLDSEIIGVVPCDVLAKSAEFYLQLNSFKGNQIMEKRLME